MGKTRRDKERQEAMVNVIKELRKEEAEQRGTYTVDFRNSGGVVKPKTVNQGREGLGLPRI